MRIRGIRDDYAGNRFVVVREAGKVVATPLPAVAAVQSADLVFAEARRQPARTASGHSGVLRLPPTPRSIA
ncbi:hypothetical protein QNO09_05700 [Streptomyces sp. 378]|nr:hypothetical protein [Streptomyces sp. 378]